MDRGHNAIYELIRKTGVVSHKSRQKFLAQLIPSMWKARTVIFPELADKIESDNKPESIERRIQDFFQKVSIDYQKLCLFLVTFIHHDKLVLAIDRTEWDYGKTQINILCLTANIGKMAVPLYFELLDNNSGNSNWEDRIQIFRSLLQVIGKDKIRILLMDREFIGHKWLSWLKKEGIPFCVRVPMHHGILLNTGETKKAEELLAESGEFYRVNNVIIDATLVNLSVFKTQKGELMYLIGTEPAETLADWYKKRWGIEVFFQALKDRGFKIESSGLRCIIKYRKLFAVAVMAYTICWATGIEDGRKNPVKLKKHGYPQYSVFRRGLNLLRAVFKGKCADILIRTIDSALARLLGFLKTVG